MKSQIQLGLPLFSRRKFLKSAAAAGVALPAVGAASGFWLSTPAFAGDLTGDITMIKGPHSAKEAEFEQMIIDDFKKVAPAVNVKFTTYDWANMNAQLTTGFASGKPSDVLYLVDLIYPNYAENGSLHDMTALADDPAWASEKSAIAPFAWDLAKSPKRPLGRAGAWRGLQHLHQQGFAFEGGSPGHLEQILWRHDGGCQEDQGRRCLRLLGADTCRRLRVLGLASLCPQCRCRSPQC